MPEAAAAVLQRGTPILIMLVLMACAACGSPVTPTQTISPSNTPIVMLNTSVAPDLRRTLPPQWTQTLTPTPSQTPTPSVTPSPLPTLSIDDLCASLEVDFPYEAEHVFAPDDSLMLIFGSTEREWWSQITAATAAPDGSATPAATRPPVMLTEPVVVRFLVVHRETGENLGAEVPGGEMTGFQLPMNQLPYAGLYDWSVSIYVGSLGERCTQAGAFTVAEGTDEP